MEKSISREIAANLKRDYSRTSIDDEGKITESLLSLLKNLMQPKGTIHGILKDAVMMIYRHLNIREVAIGLKSKEDDLYRYEVFMGFSKESEIAHKKLAYTHDDFFDQVKYRGTMISRFTKAFLAEDQPFDKGEESTYGRPVLLGQKRESLEKSLEADYFNVYIYNQKGNIVGWIEISGTKDRKFPSINDIKHIEIISSIIAITLQTEIPRR